MKLIYKLLIASYTVYDNENNFCKFFWFQTKGYLKYK